MNKDNTKSRNVIQILSLLEEYEAIHFEGNEKFRKALWKITQARHQTSTTSSTGSSLELLATSVRPELIHDATFRVFCEERRDGQEDERGETPALVDENNESTPHSTTRATSTPSLSRDTFSIIDPTTTNTTTSNSISALNEKNKDDSGTTASASSSLRQRKSSGAASQSKKETGTSSWTEEKVETPLPTSYDIINVIPGGLFHRRHLQEAQTKAEQSLHNYIRAANLLVQIQEALK